jgi:hypothetical protein
MTSIVLTTAAISFLAGLAAASLAHAEQTVCHEYGGIRYCNGPGTYRSEEHGYGGNTYGEDNRGNAWSGHQYGGKDYWQHWRR